MAGRNFEHTLDDRQHINTLFHIIGLNSEIVKNRAKCSKCGKLGVNDADVSLTHVYWLGVDNASAIKRL